jgi:NADPH:quinone reductase-like Zn-dependent oxidoreductase
LPIAGLTALQSLTLADKMLPGGLAGKTVLVVAGLSGTGSMALQMAKNIFGASKVITTVSTAKVAQVPKLLGPGVVDKIIDYTKEDPRKHIECGSVDFYFDTTGDPLAFLALMKPKTGVIISIAALPPGDYARQPHMFPDMPWFFCQILNIADAYYRWQASRWHVKYAWHGIKCTAEDLERMAKMFEDGKIKTVVGRTAKLDNLEAVRAGFMEIESRKGGIGKFVVEI